MARDQFSIHLSRAGAAAWHVDTVRFQTPLGRHGVYPEGLTLAQVFRAALAEIVEEIAQAIGPEDRILSRPDYHHSIDGLTLKGVFGHLDRLANGLVRLTIRFREVIGDVLGLLNDRRIEGRRGAGPRADAAALAAMEGVLLPLMNSVESLRARLAGLDSDPRLPTALLQVSQCCGALRCVIRRVLDDGDAAPGALPPPEEATGAEPVLPMLLAAWSSGTQDRSGRH
jgi:hypothetical protein